MKKTIRIQHGDVQGFTIDKLPAGAKKIENKPIAYGETGGHCHVLTGDVEMFEVEGKIITVVGNDGARLQHIHESQLTPIVWKSTKEIRKADHNSHLLEAGIYEFFIQNAYNPYSKIMEKVAD